MMDEDSKLVDQDHSIDDQTTGEGVSRLQVSGDGAARAKKIHVDQFNILRSLDFGVRGRRG